MPLFSIEPTSSGRTAASPWDVACLVDVDAPCNLRCTHCARARRGASGPVDVVRFGERLASSIEATGAASVAVTFFGGEPLLRASELMLHAGCLARRLGRAGTRLGGNVITNGTLLDGATAARLRSVGISRALVTVEGPREVHDRHRRLDAGLASYDEILGNLARARAHLDVVVRLEVAGTLDLARVRTFLTELEQHGLLEGERPVSPWVHGRCSYAEQARALVALDARRLDGSPRPRPGREKPWRRFLPTGGDAA